MVTEKIGKAFFWRSGKEPPRSHAAFVQFLRSFGGVRASSRERIADVFEFASFRALQIAIRTDIAFGIRVGALGPHACAKRPQPRVSVAARCTATRAGNV